MTEKNSPSQSADVGEFVISRTFDAPRSLVFKAWTDPEHLMKWWGPKGLTMLSSKLDLRPGGVFLYGMRTPDGRDMWGKWVFREIVTPQRLVFVVSFADADGNPIRHPMSASWPLEVLSTLTFAEQDGQTRLTMIGVPLNAEEIERQTFIFGRTSMSQGWKGTLDQLDDYLAKASAGIAKQTSSAPRPAAADEILTTRLLDAPRAVVFNAWTDPEQVAQWWGPNGFTNTIREMNVNPGGAWRFVMHGPNGVDYPNKIVYSEVVRPERLVYQHSGDGDSPGPEFHVTVTFEEQGGKTLLSMRARFGSVAERDKVAKDFGAVEGAKQTIDRLAQFLAKG
jgi:uncharacterized protein YndB with AHSA1/START domain